MARPLRIDVPGGFYHATARGLERKEIFRADADRRHWVSLLAELPERFNLRVHAWVSMSNHYHLQIETLEPNLSAALQWLNVSYAVWFNRKHQRVGPLFQGRFKAELTDTDQWVAEVNRYLHLNPVRTERLRLSKREQAEASAGFMTEAPSREVVAQRLRDLREYRWSSCRAYLGLDQAPPWLRVAEIRSRFGGRGEKQQIVNYRRALEEAIREGRAADPWEEAIGGALLGGVRFVERMRRLFERPNREVPGSRALRTRPTFEQWCRWMEELRGERWKLIASHHGDPARDVVLLAARRYGGMKLADIAKEVGIDYGTVGNALYRIRYRIASERETATLWKRLIKCSNQKT